MSKVESIYEAHLANEGHPTSPHLPRLRALAEGLDLAVEFGTKAGASASALLMGARRVISYDVVEHRGARALEAVAGDRWEYRIEDSIGADVPECDLIFFDSRHTFEHLAAELAAHGHKARRYLVFHDVGSSFGEVAADGETGEQAWAYKRGQSVPLDRLGIRPAIDLYQIAHPAWRIHARYVDSHGLLVLRRAGT